MLEIFAVYLAVGAVAGVLAGLFGIGGGLVIVPMLVVCFTWQGVDGAIMMQLALGTSMASIMFTAVSSFMAHHRRGAVAWDVVRRICLGILAGTYAGTFVAAVLPTRVLKVVFVVFLVFVCWQMLSGKRPKPTRQMPGLAGTSLAGVVIGAVSSLVGIGGGTLSVPFMVWHNIPLHRAIGTSAAIGFPIAVAGTLGYVVHGWGVPALPEWCLGFVSLPALLGIVLASVCTAPLGVRLAHALPVDRLKKIFAVLLLMVGLRMLWGVVA
ncbi:UPF0721 transmembrane protein [Thermodesulfomicrobium sp. WS]|uniref:sulfite exporter TauE/SafE family protein n=1 Tax=Thermodesulfomicrobium sp. WS TaxID=3004129 RepID=UPI00248F675D|nr:sulfite exporter TauE/SafE family protein [Thermodesulfomicrobium sp. WS]BDV00533.1 UPF0721 transmembrane protein [Thermodesulfomicrobium sp. WS]